MVKIDSSNTDTSKVALPARSLTQEPPHLSTVAPPDIDLFGHSPPAGSSRPDLLGLLARVGCHVYSGRLEPDGEYEELFTGPGLEELIGIELGPGTDPTLAFHAAVHPDDWNLYLAAGTKMVSDSTVSIEYRLRRSDGSYRWVLDRMWVRERLDDGSSIVDGVISDITELRDRTDEAHQALLDLQEVNAELLSARAEIMETAAWLKAAVTATPSALIILDRDLRTRLWNPAAERMFGMREQDALGRIAPHVSADQLETVKTVTDRVLEGEALVEFEDQRYGPGGYPRNVSVVCAPVRESESEITAFLGVITDITGRKEMETRLRHLAHHDPLTGLANRISLSTRIEQALADRRSSTRQVSVLLLDLDGFKAVNDSFGHSTGDELLTAVSLRLTACLRSGAVAARLGGDEFAVLLETSSRAEAIDVCERILRTLSAPIALGRAEVVITASIGVVHATKTQTSQDLLRDADVAMYMAKTSGKNRIVVFKPVMQQRIAQRLRLESQLRRAVEAGQFELHYQPIQDLHSWRVVGVEALVRWRHPRRGLLLPADFIPTTEEIGLIVPLGRWILQEACAQAARWKARYGASAPSVAVNLSPRQLHDPDLVGCVRRTLNQTGLDGSSLHVEITENLLMTDSDLAGRKLAELRSLGVGVAVDDFGTGYSSFSYLQRFPVDVLKIDRSFVAPLPDGPRPAALVRSIIELARALEVAVVAEGVETKDQALILKDLGCQVAQGFLLCRPTPARQLEAYLDTGPRPPA